MAKKKFSVMVFLECLEEYFETKISIPSYFRQKFVFKVPASATPNKDDRSGPRLSNSRSSLLGVAGAGTLKLNFVAKKWRNRKIPL